MMTASWGFMGEMWGEDTAVAMIRPQRYTMEFINKSDYYALSFYGDKKEIPEAAKPYLLKRARLIAGAENKLEALREQILKYKNKNQKRRYELYH